MRRRGAVGGALAIALVWASAASAGPDLYAPATCKVEDGTVKVDPKYWSIDLAQVGERLKISYARGNVRCPGGMPRADAVDTVEVGPTDVDIDLSRGAFGPGRTPEADGASEIEVIIGGGVINLYFGGEDDEVAIRRVGRDREISLGARSRPDAEVTVIDPGGYLLGTTMKRLLGGGGDAVDAGTEPDGETVQFDLGGGADYFRAGAGGQYVSTGRGRDRVLMGAGQDGVDAAGGGRDTVDCGPGLDFGLVDEGDRVTSCGNPFD